MVLLMLRAYFGSPALRASTAGLAARMHGIPSAQVAQALWARVGPAIVRVIHCFEPCFFEDGRQHRHVDDFDACAHRDSHLCVRCTSIVHSAPVDDVQRVDVLGWYAGVVRFEGEREHESPHIAGVGAGSELWRRFFSDGRITPIAAQRGPEGLHAQAAADAGEMVEGAGIGVCVEDARLNTDDVDRLH